MFHFASDKQLQACCSHTRCVDSENMMNIARIVKYWHTSALPARGWEGGQEVQLAAEAEAFTAGGQMEEL